MNRKITVIGTALNDKAGAIVKTDKGNYFLDGLDEWDEKYYGKKVKVTGRLVVEELTAKSTYPGEFQEMVGKKATIKKPKWDLTD